MILLIISIILGLIIFFRKKINKLVMFDLIMNIILKHEGGYVNDPDDLGGETKYGISKRSFPSIDIKNLTKSEAIELYRQNYFVPLEIDKFDLVVALPGNIVRRPDVNVAVFERHIELRLDGPGLRFLL